MVVPVALSLPQAQRAVPVAVPALRRAANVRAAVVFQRHYQSFKFSHKARCMDNYEESRLTKYTFGNLMSQGIILDGYFYRSSRQI